ncbi:MAG TPA: PepSY-associated TM helix domain-containing protein [Thermoanaerobaculia bacterium]
MRKTLFWIHLIFGALAGLVILAMSVTGVLLAFERQMVARAESHLRASGSTHLPPSQLLPPKATALTLRSDLTAPATVALGREKSLLVDPATGKSLGEGATSLKKFFHVVEDVHRWLAMKREPGKAITGASNLLFFFLVLTGVVLWWPRKSAFVFWFRGGLKGKARDFNWHNVLGFWSAIPLLLIVFSGMAISYPWVTRLIYAVAGGQPPRQQQQQQPSRAKGPTGDLDAVWRAAQPELARTMPDWKSVTFRLPVPAKGEVSLTVDAGNGARPDKRATLIIDSQTQRITRWETYAAQEGGRKARAWLRWIHTGEAGGLPGQIVAAVASAAAVVLVWTGIALALRRFTSWRRRRAVRQELAFATRSSHPSHQQ